MQVPSPSQDQTVVNNSNNYMEIGDGLHPACTRFLSSKRARIEAIGQGKQRQEREVSLLRWGGRREFSTLS